MDGGVRFSAERNQILFGIAPRMAAKLIVVHFEVCHCAAHLTMPPNAMEDLLPQPPPPPPLPEPAPPPLQETVNIALSRTMQHSPRPCRLLRLTSENAIPTARLIQATTAAPDLPGTALPAGREVTVIVRVEDVPVGDAITELGLKLHAVPDGLEQLSVTGSGNPVSLLTLTSTVPDFPIPTANRVQNEANKSLCFCQLACSPDSTEADECRWGSRSGELTLFV
jgi:hypothetical protein